MPSTSTLSILLACKQCHRHSWLRLTNRCKFAFYLYLAALHKPLQAGLNVLTGFTAFLSCDNHCFISNSLGRGESDCGSALYFWECIFSFVYRLLFSKWKLICNIFEWNGCTWAVVFNIFCQVKYVYSSCHVYRSVRVEDDVACFLSDVFLLEALCWCRRVLLIKRIFAKPLPADSLNPSWYFASCTRLNVYTWTLPKASTFSSFTFNLKRNTKAFVCVHVM